MDLFETNLNKKFPLYVSLIPDSHAWVVDALNMPWKNMVDYAFPPMALLPKGCTKTSISNVQYNSDCPRLAYKTGVLGPSGDVSGIPRQLPPIRTLLKQPLNNRYHAIPISLNLHIWYLGVQQSKNMVSLQKWQNELLLLRDSQQDPSTHPSIFQRWCTEKQVDFRNPSIRDICNFLWYLFNDLNRYPSTIEGYRTAIADTLENTRLNISTNAEIARLNMSFQRDKPKSSRSIPKWNLSLVLQRLTQLPFEPQEEAALKFLTWKTVCLLALASGKGPGTT